MFEAKKVKMLGGEAWVGALLAYPEIGGSFQWGETARVVVSTVGGAERELNHGVYIQVPALALDVNMYRSFRGWQVSSFAVNAFRFDGERSDACINMARGSLDGAWYLNYRQAMRCITGLYRSLRRVLLAHYCDTHHPEIADVSYERPSVVTMLRQKVARVAGGINPYYADGGVLNEYQMASLREFANKTAFIL